MAGGDEEFANFSRLVKLIVNVGSDVLRDVLVHVIHPQTLENTFQTNLTTINTLYYGKPKILFDEEFTLLSKIPPNPKDFDITLLIKIFRNICTTICPTVVSPNHDWTNAPGQNDYSLADDIHRMREFRNSMFAHIPNTNVKYNDFKAKWSEVRKVILRISGYGSPGLKQLKIEECIDNLKTESIDQSTFQGLLQTLREQENNHKETMEELQKMGAIQKEIRETQLKILHTQADRKTQSEIYAKMDEMHKDIKFLVRDRKEKTCRDVHGKLSYTESYEVMKLAGDTSLGETVLTIPERRATTDAADEASVFEGDGFSDEPIDRWCDLCFEKTNTKIEASRFCLECYTFLCKPCLDNHSMFPSMQNHRLLQGGRLPKTQADRPVKYLDCDIHRGNVNDQFCMDHSKMVCSQCIAEFHMACKRKLISDLCPDLGSIDIQDLRDIIETIQKNINFAKNNMEQNKDIMTIQKNEMIKEAKQVRDKLISKIENAYSSTLSDINNFYDKKVSHLSNQVFALSDMITSLDQTTLKVEEIIGTDITPDVFIQLQDMVGNVHQSQRELAELEKQLCKVDLSFSTSPEISAFLSLNNPLGSVKEDSSQLDLMTPIPRIAFPSQSRKTNKSTTRDGRIDRDISQIKATKMDLLNLKMADNQRTCDITGMAVTRNNRLLLADWGNENVKVFSPDNTLLSSLTLSGKPYDITVIDDSTAVVSTTDGKLHILDISDQASLSIQRSVSLGYRASGVAPCNNNLVVIKWTEPRCVKMITMTGAEMWSVSTDNNGQQLFENPYSVTITTINDQLTAIVTDYRKDTIILLDANNGDVIKIVDVKGKRPHGLTVDNDGNVYVCCQRSKEICVWSADFGQSRILLSGSDLQLKVQDIVYSDNTDEILICYVKVDTVDRFELS